MRQAHLPPSLLLVLSLSLPACLTPDSVTCASGLLCPAGYTCSADQNVCIVDDCGDGVVQAAETCDDGNLRDGDGCSANCKSAERCGDGVTNQALGEVCDDGNNTDQDGCSHDCRSSELCGNGIVDRFLGEVCDDGNHRSGDGCSADCLSDERCGNGRKELNELCDDGNNINGDGCSADCGSGEGCGNGITDPGEECDDGNVNDADGCVRCHLARCGDGFVNVQNEQCDTRGPSATCNADCTLSACGDGLVNVQAGEQCDGGRRDATGAPVATDTPHCDKDCTVPRCGDGYTNTQAQEACDDGNTLACGTCDASCKTAQVPKAATGTITAVSSWDFQAGEVFSVSDGNRRFFFEFVGSSGARTPHIRISLELADPASMASRIADAIQGAGSWFEPFGIAARSQGAQVLLENTKKGSSGNQPIIASVADADFLVSGMEQGVGACGRGISCTRDEDCDGGCGADHRCR